MDFIRTPPLSPFGVVNHHYPLEEWPPPERIWYVEGKASLESALCFDLTDPVLSTEEFQASFNITKLIRARYSKLPPMKEGGHIARGALYRLDDGVASVDAEEDD